MPAEPLNRYLHQSVINLLKQLPAEAVSCILVGAPESEHPETIITVKTTPEQVPTPGRVLLDVYRGRDEEAGRVAEVAFRWGCSDSDGYEFSIPFDLEKPDGLTAYLTVLQQEVLPFFFVSQDAERLFARINVRNGLTVEQRTRLVSEARQAVGC